MAVTHCESCKRYLGRIEDGDILCKCQTYNIVKNGQVKKLVIKQLYNPMATVPETQ